VLNFLSEVTKKRGIARHNLMLFAAEDALTVLDEGQAADQELLGVDGFKLSGTAIQPFLEHSIDFTTAPTKATGPDAYERCRKFIQARANDGLLFELVFPS